ncbi:MAG: 6-phosphogluconolactonase [Mariprofundaceae bacterium]|nr:6-phosphogluconolactonase [Mariprofundaceae bacterium]
MNIKTFPDAAAIAAAAALRLQQYCSDTVKQRGAFHLALAGGTTPTACYRLLSGMDMPWQQVHIYFGDERCLPAGDPERNDTMARDALLDHVPIPPPQIHSIPAELGPVEGAMQYSSLLQQAPQLDLILLGLGEDGHTASLFPDNPALDDDGSAVPVFNAPKAPPERVSMGRGYINRAREKWFLVSGAGKREAMGQIMNGNSLPAARITAARWLVEEASIPGRR